MPTKTIAYTVDGVEQESQERELTPRQILGKAGLDPEQRYLIRLKKNDKPESFKDAMDTPIRLHDEDEFITAATGPTPLS